MVIFKHVGNGQNVSLELISVHQTIMGDPNNGLDELEPNQSYLGTLSWKKNGKKRGHCPLVGGGGQPQFLF